MEHSALRPPDSSANLQRHGMAPWQPAHPDIVAVGASAGGVEAAIGVILSGMLKDGTLGLKSIKEAGGVALVQQPAEAAHPEMPMNTISAVKPVDLVGRLDMLSREIRRRTTPLPGESPPV